MTPKYILVLLSLFLFSFGAQSQTINDSVPIDTNTSVYKLWKALEIDTLPYHISHENIEKLAISSTLRLMMSSNDSTPDMSRREILYLYAKAYYDNLLAQKDIYPVIIILPIPVLPSELGDLVL